MCFWKEVGVGCWVLISMVKVTWRALVTKETNERMRKDTVTTKEEV